MSNQKSIEIGCRVRLTQVGGVDFEGVVHSMDSSIGLLALEKVLYSGGNGKCKPGIMNFWKNEVEAIQILARPGRKLKRISKTPAPAADGDQRRSDNKSHKNDREITIKETLADISKTLTRDVLAHPTFGGVETDLDSSSRAVSVLPRHLLIDTFDGPMFEATILLVLKSEVIGVAVEGIDIGRHGQLYWVQIAIQDYVILFDILKLGDRAFVEGLHEVFESERLQKVVHDCRAMADILFHQYKTKLVNIFDTQVAEVIVYMQENHNQLPNNVSPLISCVTEYLTVPLEDIYQYKITAHRVMDGSVWKDRPLTADCLKVAVLDVAYLRALRCRLMQRMLSMFVNGVDVYLGLLRDLPTTDSSVLMKHKYLVPGEFQSLARSAQRSRERTMELMKRRDSKHFEDLSKLASHGATEESVILASSRSDISRNSLSQHSSEACTKPRDTASVDNGMKLEDESGLQLSSCRHSSDDQVPESHPSHMTYKNKAAESNLLGTMIPGGCEPSWLSDKALRKGEPQVAVTQRKRGACLQSNSTTDNAQQMSPESSFLDISRDNPDPPRREPEMTAEFKGHGVDRRQGGGERTRGGGGRARGGGGDGKGQFMDSSYESGELDGSGSSSSDETIRQLSATEKTVVVGHGGKPSCSVNHSSGVLYKTAMTDLSLNLNQLCSHPSQLFDRSDITAQNNVSQPSISSHSILTAQCQDSTALKLSAPGLDNFSNSLLHFRANPPNPGGIGGPVSGIGRAQMLKVLLERVSLEKQ